MNYCQCKLVKKSCKEQISVEQTSWIPEKFAKIGKILKLKNGESWDDGWVVTTVGKPLPENALPQYYRVIKKYLKRTKDNISPTNLPK